jgi:hypothetical protein
MHGIFFSLLFLYIIYMNFFLAVVLFSCIYSGFDKSKSNEEKSMSKESNEDFSISVLIFLILYSFVLAIWRLNQSEFDMFYIINC